MSDTFQRDLDKRLEDKEFALEYGESIAKAEVALTVSQARRSHGLTQDDLAVMIGTRQSYIAKLEGGDANPTIGHVGRILATIGLRLLTEVSPISSSLEKKTGWYYSLDSDDYTVTWRSGLIPTNVTFEPITNVYSTLWLGDSANTCAYFGSTVASSVNGTISESQGDFEVIRGHTQKVRIKGV